MPRTPRKYEDHLDKTPANHVPLTPIQFLERAAHAYPDKTSIIHGRRRYTWRETYARARRLASALTRRGIGKGATVAVMAANTPELYEAHFGVPMTGAVLNALNVRLNADDIAFILDHGEAEFLITDREFSATVRKALEKLESPIPVIDIDDPEAGGVGARLGETDYEALLAEGDPDFAWVYPDDEWNAITLNYTSGTTGNPKGVVYHSRGAYLNALGNIVTWGLGHDIVYLWTLPMFHCNGWCFPWTLAALAGTNVCCRKVSADAIFGAIADHGVTHFCGAPIVLGFVINASDAERRAFDHTVNVMTAAAPPPAPVLARMAAEGFKVTHTYGLTEVYGPATVCAWHDDWDRLDMEDQARLKSRQGVRYPVQEGVMVAHPETLEPVPWDGETMGEVFFRGNITMRGYLKNPAATEKALAGGWFHSGDLGVTHPDGYIQLKDRSKDIIISGGENISSIEVEGVLYRHPDVVACGVVAKPDDKWGETPVAVVELRDGATVTEAELIAFCRDALTHYKCPREIIFDALPKTSTGKIQKYLLREHVQRLIAAGEA
ncbi:acyl-CoA synthetase [Roseospira visakhapatnamensis]|uniref:3-methylmercaptopropionyl-CoA ligase n=1 Tax=Roseospira visakhapatnamensis TaxID=390880 RepID=A0A7W6RFQ8_9PROT|nr:acyl-CoA synthetase [Roseospira visakhapatnamensis]MBB4267432.1 fatty-acyl-CoA synthase [Roseospira visakhapatnamensis]